jgi:predicted RNA-binding protein YlqC (UPF0109 family)
MELENLLAALARGLVDDPTAVQVVKDPPNEDGVVFFHLNVADDDMGRVIGKQGKIAKAIRTVMRAAATRQRLKISVEIDDEIGGADDSAELPPAEADET